MCPFCQPEAQTKALLESKHNLYIASWDKVLLGSGMIITKQHRETLFDVTEEEFVDSYHLLHEVKKMLDEQLHPDGYNVGWNCYPVGGQTVAHVHMHIIPRYQDEPMAGKGIRHHLKQIENTRTSIR